MKAEPTHQTPEAGSHDTVQLRRQQFCKPLTRHLPQCWSSSSLLWFLKLPNTVQGRDGRCAEAHRKDLPAILWAARTLWGPSVAPEADVSATKNMPVFLQMSSSLQEVLLQISEFWTGRWEPFTSNRRACYTCSEQQPAQRTGSLFFLFSQQLLGDIV